MTETPHDPQGEAVTHRPPDVATTRPPPGAATAPIPPVRNGAAAARAAAPVQATGDGAAGTAAAAGGGFGLPAAMALIVGSIIGVGIFNLPTSLAALRADHPGLDGAHHVGALALALLFAALSRRLPADGGPYAYARVAFGNRLGFVNAWSYWITAWAGNAAHRGRLGAVRRALHQQGPEQAVHGAAGAGRPVDPGR